MGSAHRDWKITKKKGHTSTNKNKYNVNTPAAAVIVGKDV